MSLWSRIGLWPSLGILIEDRQISLSVVASTPKGRTQVHHETLSCEEGTHRQCLEQLLGPWLKRGKAGKDGTATSKSRARSPWVQIALPDSRVFHAIVPITGANRSAPPQAFFIEATQATNMRAEERVFDLVKLELNRKPFASLAASQRPFLMETLDTLNSLGARVAMVEAAPASLYRAGIACKKAPRNSNLSVRFFLGKTQGLGVLGTDMPLLWHTFDLPADNATRAVMGTYSTLWMQSRYVGIGQPIDTVIVHGRPDLDLGYTNDAFHEKTGARLIRLDTPDNDAASTALGAASATPLIDSSGINLARGFRPVVPIREIFPWGELALQCVLVAGVTMYLHGKAVELDTKFKTTEVELHSIMWLKDQTQAKLEAEKKLLDDRLKALENFADTRVDWSAQLRTIGNQIPETTLVTSFQGTCEVADKGKANIKNQMVVNFNTPLNKTGEIPPEINDFISALRVEPTLKRSFPTIDVSGVEAKAGQGEKSPSASYSIVCKPGQVASKGDHAGKAAGSTR